MELPMALLNAIATGGVAGAILYYVMTKMVPKLLQDHKEQLEKKDQNLLDVVASKDLAERERNTADREQRKEFAVSLDKVCETFKAVTDKTETTFRQEVTAERLACEKHFQTVANVVTSTSATTIKQIEQMIEQGRRHEAANREQMALLKQREKESEGGTT